MKLLRERQVRDKVAIGKTLLWSMVKRGDFPQPLKLTRGTTVWVETEVDEYILRLMQGERPTYEPRT